VSDGVDHAGASRDVDVTQRARAWHAIDVARVAALFETPNAA
jgi:hypothetical protein